MQNCTVVVWIQSSVTPIQLTTMLNGLREGLQYISCTCDTGIRASVDALCRDGTGQISRDPHKNCLKTRRECLTRPSKLAKSHSRASIQLSTCRKASYVAPVLCARIRSHAISQILVIITIFFLFFSKPAISMLERVDRLILSRSVSRVGGGVHGHRAIVSFLFLVSTVDHGALQGSQ